MTTWVEAALSVEDAIRALSPEAKAYRPVLFRRARQRHYNASPRGRLRNRRYDHTPAGQARARKYEESIGGRWTRGDYAMSGARMMSRCRGSIKRNDADLAALGVTPEQTANMDRCLSAYLAKKTPARWKALMNAAVTTMKGV